MVTSPVTLRKTLSVLRHEQQVFSRARRAGPALRSGTGVKAREALVPYATSSMPMSYLPPFGKLSP